MKCTGHGFASVGSNADLFLRQDICRYAAGSFDRCCDSIIQECALDIMVNGRLHRSMTCSPWDIEELTAGVLYFDGVVSCRDEIERMAFDLQEGFVEVETHAHRDGRYRDAAVARAEHLHDGFTATPSEVNALIDVLENGSKLFHRTGGVHSAVLAGPEGTMAWFEDIGRHSAVDKLAGWCVLNDISAADKALVFSGRVPCEIISKVAAMGWPLVVSPGAPTSLSIDVARRAGITLVGFAKQGRFNVYSHPERIRADRVAAIAC